MNRLRQLEREDGIALIMALGVLLVLSITLTSVVYYTSSSSRDASRSHAGQKAYALVEAALNDAAAQIASHYYDSSGTPNNISVAGDQSWISSSWVATQQQQSPSSTSACTSSSSCMQWSATWCPTPYTAPAACTSLPAPSSTTKGTWLISAKGTMPNPTGPTASPITRTLQGKIDVSFETKPGTIWQWLYSGNTTTIAQSASVQAPLWVRNTLFLQQSAAIEQPSGATGNRLVVGFDRTASPTGGNLDLTSMNSSGHVGGNGTTNPPTTWLSEAHLSGSCRDSNGTYCKTNGGGRVWITGGLSASAPTQTFPADTLQPADWLDRYANASPGPNHSCAGGPFFDKNGVPDGLNDDAGSFNLIGSSYNCTIDANDYIAYNATTHVLSAKGTIFFDGDLTINGTASYVGIANIYASGLVTFANNAALCARLSGSACDLNGWNPNYDAASNPNPSMLILAAYGYNGGTSVSGTNMKFQGGLYGQSSIIVGGGTSQVQGPLVSPGTVTIGQGGGSSFPIAGIFAPGYPLDPYKLGPLQNQTG